MNRKSFLKSIGIAAVAGPSIVKAEKKPAEPLMLYYSENGIRNGHPVDDSFMRVKVVFTMECFAHLWVYGPGRKLLNIGNQIGFIQDVLVIERINHGIDNDSRYNYAVIRARSLNNINLKMPGKVTSFVINA